MKYSIYCTLKFLRQSHPIVIDVAACFCYNVFEVNAVLVPQGDTLDIETSACIWSAGSKTKHDFDFLLVQRKFEVTHSI